MSRSLDSITDAAYERRRGEISALSAGLPPEASVPVVEYTDWEHDVWRTVRAELAGRHRTCAAAEYLDSVEQLAVPVDHVPQLRDVSSRLASISGFRFRAAPALVPFPEFCGGLAKSVFHSTQYLRHPRSPFYTEEPDLLHDVVGHGGVLTSKRFARLYRLAGEAAVRVRRAESVQFISKVFWFTLECGVVRERGMHKAYGATLVSSCGELDQFRAAEFRPLDIKGLVDIGYDISTYQPILFEVSSMDQLEDTAGTFWNECDDDSIAALLRSGPSRSG
ncbi:phenylalanine 4-monooxygenase [Amycolatopsis sp. FBCC-B4732]|uniref:phenylalanine 4-monooxygenase n=1 Tax=Amycolatopsis sp. FBCC-B4732 TaxID=3079339 RepID=UPI001FF4FC63|nr:phenylalanine 4-monooxygenase [Amycolatopsis sp. FBCC-B4732]UOX90025.1 phenylalanine 4-monooxygenase [Amycolatopsis sp. FBCC-B4732]